VGGRCEAAFVYVAGEGEKIAGGESEVPVRFRSISITIQGFVCSVEVDHCGGV
jgi:hypothetical protein